MINICIIKNNIYIYEKIVDLRKTYNNGKVNPSGGSGDASYLAIKRVCSKRHPK